MGTEINFVIFLSSGCEMSSYFGQHNSHSLSIVWIVLMHIYLSTCHVFGKFLQSGTKQRILIIKYHLINIVVFFNLFSDMNECASSPCMHGATCVDQISMYTCQCLPGYIDTNCQTGNFDYTLVNHETMHILLIIYPSLCFCFLC